MNGHIYFSMAGHVVSMNYEDNADLNDKLKFLNENSKQFVPLTKVFLDAVAGSVVIGTASQAWEGNGKEPPRCKDHHKAMKLSKDGDHYFCPTKNASGKWCKYRVYLSEMA